MVSEVHAQHLRATLEDAMTFFKHQDEHRAAIDALERESDALLKAARPHKRGTEPRYD
jgi:hypothetical protein